MLIGKGGGLRHLDGAHIRVIFADHQNGLTYRRLKALQDVSLKVAAGEIVAVVGANGAGKSTLLEAIAGQVAIEGTIRFDGQTLASVPSHRIARIGRGSGPVGTAAIPALVGRGQPPPGRVC